MKTKFKINKIRYQKKDYLLSQIKNSFWKVGIALTVAVVLVGLNFTFAQWEDPTEEPPAGNITPTFSGLDVRGDIVNSAAAGSQMVVINDPQGLDIRSTISNQTSVADPVRINDNLTVTGSIGSGDGDPLLITDSEGVDIRGGITNGAVGDSAVEINDSSGLSINNPDSGGFADISPESINMVSPGAGCFEPVFGCDCGGFVFGPCISYCSCLSNGGNIFDVQSYLSWDNFEMVSQTQDMQLVHMTTETQPTFIPGTYDAWGTFALRQVLHAAPNVFFSINKDAVTLDIPIISSNSITAPQILTSGVGKVIGPFSDSIPEFGSGTTAFSDSVCDPGEKILTCNGYLFTNKITKVPNPTAGNVFSQVLYDSGVDSYKCRSVGYNTSAGVAWLVSQATCWNPFTAP